MYNGLTAKGQASYVAYKRGDIMPRILRTLLLTAVIVADVGCYHTRVFTNGQPATAYTQKTVHSLFWGLVQQNVEPPSTDNCVSNAMQEVRVTTNLGYAFLTVVTLGLWSPMEIEWRCAKQLPPNPGPIGSTPAALGEFTAERLIPPPVPQQEESHAAR
jgi:Bor protein